MTVPLAESDPGTLALQVARQVRSRFRFGFDGRDSEVVLIPPGSATRLTAQLANTVQRSLLQIVPLGARSEIVGSFADDVWRSVAVDNDRQIVVQRLLLIPPGYSHLPEFDEEDEAIQAAEGRLQVRTLALRDVTDETLPLPLTNAWLIDDSAVVAEVPDGLSTWQVSARQEDIESFHETWRQLWGRAVAWPTRPDPAALTEPLLQSADAMATVAKMTCSKPLYGQGSCNWFHSVWQYLRLFDMVSSPDWHIDFYLSALSAVLDPFLTDKLATPKVLISGAADYSMLAYVLTAAKLAGVDAEVHVLDQCRTPLIACGWYARHYDPRGTEPKRKPLRLYELDIKSARSRLGSGKYDLITADAYLTRFYPQDARKVIRIWRELLHPGGAVVTTVRLHPLDAPRGAALDEVSDFALRAQAAARRWRAYIKAGVDELTAAARLYAVSMRSFDLGDAAAVIDLFSEAGFDIEYEQQGAAHGELRKATYLRVVARKL